MDQTAFWIGVIGILSSVLTAIWCSSKFKSIQEVSVRLNNQINKDYSELNGLQNRFNDLIKNSKQNDLEKTRIICSDLEWQVRALRVKTGNVVYPDLFQSWGTVLTNLSTEDCYELKKDVVVDGVTYKAGEKVGLGSFGSEYEKDTMNMVTLLGRRHKVNISSFLSWIVSKQDFEARIRESEKDLDTALEELHDEIEVKELFEANNQKREEIEKLKEELRLANEKIKKLEKKKTR